MPNAITIDILAKDMASGVIGNVGKGISSLGKDVAMVAAAGFAALSAVVVGTVAGLAKLTEATIEYGVSLHDTERQLGLTAEQAAGWSLLADRAGTSTEEANMAFFRFSKTLETVKDKASTSGIEMAKLGIEVFDANGKMRPTTDLFGEIATKLEAMTPGLEKDRIMMELFGRSGVKMDDMLEQAANGGMADFIKQAGEMGLALSDADIEKTHAITLAQKQWGETLKGLGVTLTRAMLPAISKFMEILNKIVSNPAIKTGLETIGTVLGKVAEVIVNLVQNTTGHFGIVDAFYSLGKLSPIFIKLGDAVAWIGRAIQDVQKFLAQAAPDWAKLGKDILDNIGNGIHIAADWVDKNIVQPLIKWALAYDWATLGRNILYTIGTGLLITADYVDIHIVQPIKKWIESVDWPATGRAVIWAIGTGLLVTADWVDTWLTAPFRAWIGNIDWGATGRWILWAIGTGLLVTADWVDLNIFQPFWGYVTTNFVAAWQSIGRWILYQIGMGLLVTADWVDKNLFQPLWAWVQAIDWGAIGRAIGDAIGAAIRAAIASAVSYGSIGMPGGTTPGTTPGQPGHSGQGPGHGQAAGGDYLVNKPTWFLAGEAGPERATFTPQHGAGAGKMPGGDGMIVNIYGWQGDGASLAAEIERQQRIQRLLA